MSISSPSPMTPQCPCEVYSQRQTSVMRTRSSRDLAAPAARAARLRRRPRRRSPRRPSPSGMPKRITALDAEPCQLVGLAAERLDGVPGEPRQVRVRKRFRPDEQRHDEVVEVEPRFADEVAQPTRPAKPPQPRDRKGAHDRSLDPCLKRVSGARQRRVPGTVPGTRPLGPGVTRTQRRAAAGGGSASSSSTGTADRLVRLPGLQLDPAPRRTPTSPGPRPTAAARRAHPASP